MIDVLKGFSKHFFNVTGIKSSRMRIQQNSTQCTLVTRALIAELGLEQVFLDVRPL